MSLAGVQAAAIPAQHTKSSLKRVQQRCPGAARPFGTRPKFCFNRENRRVVSRRAAADAPQEALAGGGGVYEALEAAQVVDPRDGSVGPALEGCSSDGRLLVVLLPQLGDFDSAEYGEQLAAVTEQLAAAGMALRVIGIGESGSAQRFADFTGLPLDVLRVDPEAAVHRAIGTHEGPGWGVPDQIPQDLKPTVKAWTNYMAMCAGIGAPGTLQEILRGYVGDRSAPERLSPDTTVTAGPVEVVGTKAWKIGPLGADLWWKDEAGYQRPVELATVRLRVMAEVLGNWGEYVKNDAYLAQRGATFVFEDGKLVYEWRDRGVLTYSETMPRPLSFLEPWIGDPALNALGLGDTSRA